MSTNLQLTEQQIREYGDLAYLGLGKDLLYKKYENPLDGDTHEMYSDPYRYFIKYMMDIDNIWWLCKIIFNVNLLPYQVVIMQELWNHKFPMLIGSRGLGKCITGDSYIVTNRGFERIGDFVGDAEEMQRVYKKADILGENGFTPLDYCWNNGYSETRKIQTRYGYNLEATTNHPIRVVRDGEIVWVNAEDVKIDDYIPIDRSEQQWPIDTNNTITEDMAYLFGVLVGDGGYTVRGRITITNQSSELVDRCSDASEKIWGKRFKLINSSQKKIDYVIYGVDVWDELFAKYGFNSPVCGEKDVPKCILNAPKNVIASFLRGLFDTDGCCEKGAVTFCTKSKNLASTLQFLLTRFGIISRTKKRLNKKYQTYYYYFGISSTSSRKFEEQIGFCIDYKKDRLKKLNSTLTNPNVDVLPHALILSTILQLREKFKNKFGLIEDNEQFGKMYAQFKLKSYQLSYRKLGDFLKHTEILKDEPEWIKLNDIFNKNYFYDRVVKIQSGFAQTFDVHLNGDHSFISNGMISHNSFLLSLYCMVKALLCPGCKVVVAGAGLRQSLLLFDYCSKIWDSSPMLQNIATQGGQKSGQGPKKGNDRCSIFLGESSIVFIPIGSGEKIRGLRSNVTVVDEFASQNEDIFERVIGGFGVVTQDPIKSVREAARKDFLKEIHLTQLIEEEDASMGNQTIIAGTAYYDFNHFARYWKRWKAIIETKGNKAAIKEFCGSDDIPEYLDYRDYCVIRIPVELLPRGYMDEAQIARAKATIHNGIFQMEYGAIFTRDSEGFFRRTLIESCVASDNKPVRLSTGPVTFHAVARGNISRKYVYGVDPAALQDNFAIVILELCGNHRRIVYCWTTNKSRHRELLKKNQTIGEMDYYAYCARKLRELMKTFPCDRIGMDAQGGGIAIEEALQDTLRMMTGEQRILRTIEDDKPKPTDDEHGLHILDMVQFASNDWVREANHGMRMDFENKTLLFPHFDPAMLEGASLVDEFSDNRVYDSLEEVMTNIEELKDELAAIVYTQTTNGTDRWDTPEVKMPGNKKGRLRKDRYSALLIANMVARQFEKQKAGFTYDEGRVATDKSSQIFEVGPAWYMEGMKNSAIYNQ